MAIPLFMFVCLYVYVCLSANVCTVFRTIPGVLKSATLYTLDENAGGLYRRKYRKIKATVVQNTSFYLTLFNFGTVPR